MKLYLPSSCWWLKKRTVRRHILEFSEVWTPWALPIGWKSREGSRKAMDYIGNDKWKEWMKEMKNVNNEEWRKNYRRLRNELERTTEKAKNESLESLCDDVMEFQRTGLYDSVYLKTSLERKECYSKHRHRRRPREYNSTYERSTEDLGELYFSVLWSKSSTIKHRIQNWEEDNADEKGPYILLSEMEKAIK